MEVVLGIDNLIFIAILTNKLPPEQQPRARMIGIGLALIMRLALLGTVALIVQLTTPIFTRVRSWLLLARPDPDRGRPVPGLEGDQGNPSQCRSRSRPRHVRRQAAQLGFAAAIGQILLLDLVFSIDSIITAVGMTDDIPIMVIAVVVAVLVMLLAANPLSNFIDRNPTVVMLALGFLLMIGMALIAEGFGAKVPKGYIYAAMAFSAFIELLNVLAQKGAQERRRNSAQRRQCRRGFASPPPGLGMFGFFQHHVAEIGDDVGEQRGAILGRSDQHEIGQHFGDLRGDLTEIGALARQFGLQQVMDVAMDAFGHASLDLKVSGMASNTASQPGSGAGRHIRHHAPVPGVERHFRHNPAAPTYTSLCLFSGYAARQFSGRIFRLPQDFPAKCFALALPSPRSQAEPGQERSAGAARSPQMQASNRP